jgi:uncharacterized protein (DUF2141 family)
MLQKSTTIIILLLLSFSSCIKDTSDGDNPTVIDSLLLNTKINIEVYDFENFDGNLAIAIYNSSSTFNSETLYYRDTVIAVTATDMLFEIDSMAPGTYAISILHDADESGDMEMGGIFNLVPQEGFGFSNNPAIGLSEPSFNDCKFEIEEGQSVSVPITLIYM